MAGERTREALVAVSFLRLQHTHEHMLLLEWIDFHLIQGVTKFILYRYSSNPTRVLRMMH